MNKSAKGTMEIENFRIARDQKCKIFKLPQNKLIEFYLYCHPAYSKNVIGYEYTTLYLYLNSCPKTQITVRHEISIVNAKGHKCEKQDKVETFTLGEYGGLYHARYDHLVIPENGYLVDGKLSIYYEIEEIDPTNQNLYSKNKFYGKMLDNPILKDYQSLLKSGKLSDVSLIVKIGEKRLIAHKNILSARSKVFSAMFENDCEEKRQNCVKITDISAEVCEQMLSYIYTGEIPDLSEYAADLLVAADKYELEHLKAVCEQHLSSKIEFESAAKTLLLADMHHANVLKTKSVDFIVENATKVMATEGWKALTNRSDLLVDLFQKMTIKANR